MTQLVYGYNLDNAGNLTLQVYDPNDNSNDNSTISLNISVPAHTNTISAPGIEAAIADPATIRGLFRAAYNYTNPSALQLMPYPGVWTGVDRSSVGSFTGAGRDELLYYWAGFGNTAGDPTWTGDFTGSGRSEVLFYSPGDQNWWLGTFNGTTLSWNLAGNTRGFGNTAGDPTWTGDFTSNGHADVLF